MDLREVYSLTFVAILVAAGGFIGAELCWSERRLCDVQWRNTGWLR